MWTWNRARPSTRSCLTSMTAGWGEGIARPFIFICLLSEAMLLSVAAQTGFLDGPRVLANMSLDRWFPTRFSVLSDRLVIQNGILIMGGLSLVIMLLTGGSVRLLVVLYSINVFITFCLSQLGMVRHWWLDRHQTKILAPQAAHQWLRPDPHRVHPGFHGDRQVLRGRLGHAADHRDPGCLCDPGEAALQQDCGAASPARRAGRAGGILRPPVRAQGRRGSGRTGLRSQGQDRRPARQRLQRHRPAHPPGHHAPLRRRLPQLRLSRSRSAGRRQFQGTPGGRAPADRRCRTTSTATWS